MGTEAPLRAVTKSSPIASRKKTIATCYNCRASFALELAKLPPDVLSIKCFECGSDVQILARVVKARSKEGQGASSIAAAAPKSRAAETGPLDDYDPGGFGSRSFSEGEGEADDNMQWLATYGDMMSILLIFFVLMFAISTIDKRKFETAMTSISSALGGKVAFKVPEVPHPGPPPESLEELQKRIEAAKKLSPLEEFRQEVQTEKEALSDLRGQIMRIIEEQQLGEKFTLLDENEGLVLVAQDVVMFNSGRAEIRPDMLPNIQRIGSILAAIKNNIVVEGHTDDVPISSGRFASNWELSVTRATNVVHFLISQCAVEPSRLAAAGYAHFRPRYNNKSADREKNRRIEVVVKKKYSDNLVDGLLNPNQETGLK